MTSAAIASSGSPCSARRRVCWRERKAIRPSSQPRPAPSTSAMTTLPTRSQASQPTHDPSDVAVPVAMSSAAPTKGKRQPVVEAGLRGQREADVVLLVDRLGLLLVDRAALMLAALPRGAVARSGVGRSGAASSAPASIVALDLALTVALGLGLGRPDVRPPDLHVPREHRVGGRQRRTEQQRRSGREPEAPAEQGHPGDRQRHADREQPPRRRPPRPARAVAQAQRPVDGEPHSHQRDEHGELGDAVDLGPDLQRVEGEPLGHGQQAHHHADDEQHHGGRDRIALEEPRAAPPRAAGRCRE